MPNSDRGDSVSFGVSVPETLNDKLEAYASDRAAVEGGYPNKSATVALCSRVGLEANRVIDDKYGPSTNLRPRIALARQALISHESDVVDDSQFLVEALADAEDIDPDALERAVLELKLDSSD